MNKIMIALTLMRKILIKMIYLVAQLKKKKVNLIQKNSLTLIGIQINSNKFIFDMFKINFVF